MFCVFRIIEITPADLQLNEIESFSISGASNFADKPKVSYGIDL
ncbi:hypothetical protein [Aquimarina amphilecti]|nr:hypothetical protein [Aquimarina amphilecti]